MLVLAGCKLGTRANAGEDVGQPASRRKDYTPRRGSEEARYMRMCCACAFCLGRDVGIGALCVRFAVVVMQEHVDFHRGPGPVFRTIFWSQFGGSDARSFPVKQQASFFSLFQGFFFSPFRTWFFLTFSGFLFSTFQAYIFHLVGLPGSHVFGLPFCLRLKCHF